MTDDEIMVHWHATQFRYSAQANYSAVIVDFALTMMSAALREALGNADVNDKGHPRFMAGYDAGLKDGKMNKLIDSPERDRPWRFPQEEANPTDYLETRTATDAMDERNTMREEAMVASTLEDELRSCLRGAITAMEVLQDLIRDYGTHSYLPGLPDLIQRCKKAVDA